MRKREENGDRLCGGFCECPTVSREAFDISGEKRFLKESFHFKELAGETG
jgi:hypothetical protein